MRIACISWRGRKRNLYEELARTIDEIEEGGRNTDEELSALKDRLEKNDEVSKNERRKE